MNESTTSSAEMSISTPFAPVATIFSVRSSCSFSAIRSCRSTWMLTSKIRPSLSIGIRSMTLAERAFVPDDPVPESAERVAERVGERRPRDHVAEVDAQVHDRLRDLGPYAADYALRAHQLRGRHGLQQVLRDQRIDRR